METDTKVESDVTDESGPSQAKATQQFRQQSAAVRDDLRELGRLGRDVAQEKLGDARRAATDLYDQGRRRAGDLEDQIVEYVRQQPMKSMLIATGVGLLIGMIWAKR